MKRPFIIVQEIIAIVFFIVGLWLTMFLLKYTRPTQKNTPTTINAAPVTPEPQ